MATKPAPKSPEPLKPRLRFLFGRQVQPSNPAPPLPSTSPPQTKRAASASASSQLGLGSQDLASIAHSHPHPPATTQTNNLNPHPQFPPPPPPSPYHHHNDPPLHRLSLDLALQYSSRSSIDSNCSDLLHESVPLTFAPTMAASPAGGGHS